MLFGLIILYLEWFVKAPWWLYIPTITLTVVSGINFMLMVYEEGRKEGAKK